MTPDLQGSVLPSLMRDEGKRLTPYRCTAGKLTIGYGTNLDAGITDDEALFLLENRVNLIIADLRRRVPWFDRLDKPRQGVLVQMAYQMGVDGLLKFSRTLAAIERGDYEAAADFMLDSLWARQTPARAARHAYTMRTGKAK